ncbi:MAG TPA: ImmA/IrrE family metallo-endopeptidase [Armatimonadota bacterium]|jgi:predicted transcriptional regulator
MQQPIAVTASELDRAVSPFLRKYAYVDHRNIASFTGQFCREFRLNSIPQDPFSLLPEHFGVEIRRASRPSTVAAMWMLDTESDRYIIQINGYRNARGMSLSLFHELFEILSSNDAFPTRLGSAQECELAWQFASHLTMPEKPLRAMASELGHPDVHDKTDVLASRFNVSIAAMRMRLKALGIAGKRVYRS